jgi:uncharacterized protein (TIGR02588 family)
VTNRTTEREANRGVAGRAIPFGELAVGVLGLVMVLGVLGFLLYEAFQPNSAPAVVVEPEQIIHNASGYLVLMRAANQGGETAAAVVVEGSLLADDGAEPVELSELTFDYVPANSYRQGGLFFVQNPEEFDLRLQVKSYVDP